MFLRVRGRIHGSAGVAFGVWDRVDVVPVRQGLDGAASGKNPRLHCLMCSETYGRREPDGPGATISAPRSRGPRWPADPPVSQTLVWAMRVRAPSSGRLHVPYTMSDCVSCIRMSGRGFPHAWEKRETMTTTCARAVRVSATLAATTAAVRAAGWRCAAGRLRSSQRRDARHRPRRAVLPQPSVGGQPVTRLRARV